MNNMNTSDKVVCIDDGPCKCCGHPVPVLKGQVYTVEFVFEASACNELRTFLAVVLVGVPASFGHRRGIGAWRFRTLSEVQMIVSAVSGQKPYYEPTTLH
jgi:hypothetical protein